jgi:hypothetical protein
VLLVVAEDRLLHDVDRAAVRLDRTDLIVHGHLPDHLPAFRIDPEDCRPAACHEQIAVHREARQPLLPGRERPDDAAGDFVHFVDRAGHPIEDEQAVAMARDALRAVRLVLLVLLGDDRTHVRAGRHVDFVDGEPGRPA